MGPIEHEFDPTVYPPEYVTVGISEPIQPILEKIEAAWERSPNAVLIIPRGAQAFHTTHDFLALGKLQGAREVRVSIVSLDPTIEGLARVLGFHIVDPPEGHPALADDPSLGSVAGSARDNNDIEKPTAPLQTLGIGIPPDWVLTPAIPTAHTAPPAIGYRPAGMTTTTWLNYPGDPAVATEARPSQPLQHEQVARAGVPPPRTKPRQTGQLSGALLTDPSLPARREDAPRLPTMPRPHVSPTASGRIKARSVLVPVTTKGKDRGLRHGGGRAKVRWGRIVAALVFLLVASLAGSSAYAYVYLPEGTVAVTPGSKTIDAVPLEIAVLVPIGQTGQGGGVAPQGQINGDGRVSTPTLAAVPVVVALREEGTRSSSGTRQVARGKAQGTVRFTNGERYPIPVPAGFGMKATNGVLVQTTEGGTVPATAIGGAWGTLDLPVAATVEGPDGNVAAGTISGVWEGQLSFRNNAPLKGGTLETIKVVKQEDIDASVAEARARMEERRDAAIYEKVVQGQQLITQTITLDKVAFVADHKAGEDGEAVRVELAGEARAYVFEEAGVRDVVTQGVLDWMMNSEPRETAPSLDRNSIQYAPPTLQSVDLAQGRVIYATSASARVTYSLTSDLASSIRELVKGQNVEQARTLINERYSTYLSASTIRATLLWFNIDKLPDDPARIEVEASGAPGGSNLSSSLQIERP